MIPQILSAYRHYLQNKHGDQVLKKYDDRYRDNQEAALSEAVVFNWLCGNALKPELNECLKDGGVDFICNSDYDDKFVVEVTCLGREALTKATGLHMKPGQHMPWSSPTHRSSPTHMLRKRVSDKAPQLSRYDMPRILVLTSLHDGAYMVLTPKMAINFLISDSALTFPVGGDVDDSYLSTDLKEAIFFKPDKDNPMRAVPCRQSVSAVLLMPIAGDKLNVTGISHPEPSHPFDITLLPRIPFLRVENWASLNDEIFTEWTISDPYAATFSLSLRIETP